MGTDSETGKEQKEVIVEDRFKKLKFIGYCMAFLPPPGHKSSFGDLVRFAKYQLCREKKLLMKDPIWENYGDEEILVEYYAGLFEKNQELKAEFEAALTEQDPEFMKWLDKELKENKDKISESKKLGEFDFEPSALGGE